MLADGKRYILYGSRSDRFRIQNIADPHWGSAACAEEHLKDDIEAIRTDPFAFWLGTGDNAEFVGYRDKRFDPDSVAPGITVKDLGRLGKVLTTGVRDLYAPIKEKCLGLGKGNHELQYELHTDQRGLHEWLCLELGVPNLGYCSIFDIVFCRTANRNIPELVREDFAEPCTRRAFRCIA